MLTGPQQIFAEAYALEANASAAYAKAYPKAKANSCRSQAPLLLAKPAIKAEIARIRAAAQERAGGAVLTLEEALTFLSDVVRTPVGKVDETSPLAQEVVYDEGPNGSSKKVKMVGKSDAMKQLADYLGWSKAKQIEMSGTGPVTITIGA